MHFATAQDNIVSFNIQPNRCVLAQNEPVCQFSARFAWQANQVIQQVCLWQSTELIKCWSQLSGGEIKPELNLQQTTPFYLTLSNTFNPDLIIAEQSIQILNQQTGEYRRRLHSQWSLF
ncbi:DUF3019 domain-containing protein [Catenovulum sp. 2E275]|uniref:DUF3019 domain-containing protein n=1 Tax=Catenovulum sp. 2E275 TaxID=2980497 RepID=UPI0021CFFD81|nr:DUF3019 domain-containing protein [Catenovulum sp. 2E275]